MRLFLWLASLGFLAGVFLAWFTDFGLALGLWVFMVALATIALTRERYALLAFCLLVGVGLGIVRYVIIPAPPTVRDSTLNSYVGDVIQEPKEGESGAGFFVQLVATGTQPSLKIYTSTFISPDIQYGDRVEIRGKLVNARTEKAPEYWKAYLQTQGIAYEIKNAQIIKIESGHGNPMFSALLSFKKFITSKITDNIPEPEAALLAGILLGAKSSLGNELTDQFNKVGVSHIIALSGFNITIIASGIAYVFEQSKFLPFTAGIYTSGILIILFVLMTGASASAVRAAVMAMILLLARKEGRTYDAGTALIVAAIVMVLWNPLVLIDDFGFQLSFLAAIGIIYLMPILDLKCKKFPNPFKLKEILLGTISAEAMVMPLIIYKTGVGSLISLIANALILPIVPILMTLGFILIIVAPFGYYVALPIAWLNYIFLLYIISVVRFLYHVPYAFILLPSASVSLILLWYLFMIYVMLKHHAKVHPTTVS